VTTGKPVKFVVALEGADLHVLARCMGSACGKERLAKDCTIHPLRVVRCPECDEPMVLVEEPIIAVAEDEPQAVYARVVKHFREHATTAGEEQERIIGEMRKAMENLTLQIEGAIRGGSTVTWNFNYPTRRSYRPVGSAILPEEHEHTGETIVTIHVRQ
jgi:hypothetical protein